MAATFSLSTAVRAQTSITAAPDGTGTLVNASGNTFTITGGTTSSSGTNLFHSFADFGLNSNQIANFQALSTISNILTRVTGGNPSLIDGQIRVTGSTANLFFLNPAGIIFGANANLDVAGSFTVSTANGITFGQNWFSAIGPNDYAALNGAPQALGFTTAQPGAIVNAGNLAVGPGKTLALIGGTVVNTGQLLTPGGTVTVAAVPGENYVRLSTAGSVLSYDLPLADATQPNPTTQTALSLSELLTSPLETGLTVQGNGAVALTGTTIPTDTGTTIASGHIDVTSTAAEGLGGTVQVFGEKVGLVGAQIDASGTAGGGTVLIGGDFQGRGTVPNAAQTYVSSDSLIQANALTQGDGGRVIVWADNTTQFYGTINANGGRLFGDGGFVETSGKEYLEVLGGAVNAIAFSGRAGSWLLDPRDVTIQDAASARGTFTGSNPSIFTPTGNNAIADRNTIQTSLNNGTDVTVTTGTTGSQPGNITVQNTITKSSGSNALLTLNAANDINVNADITSTSGQLNVNLAAGGNINFAANADIITNGGDLSTSGVNFDSSSGTINAGSGTVSLGHTGTVNLGNLTVDSLSITAGDNITDSGILNVAGVTTLNTATNRDITLDSTTNNLNIVSVVNARNVSLVDTNAINLSASNISGNLTVTATGITQNGSLVVGNATTLNAGIGDILLNTSTNNFNVVSVTNAGNVTLVDTNAINLGTSNISGNLTVTATGITQSGSLVVGNATTLNAGVGNITLGTSTNNFNTISVTNAGNVTLVDTNAINLSASNISGNLSVNAAGGNITESGALRVTGDSSFTVANGNSIILDANNSFNGTVGFNSTGTIRDITVRDSDGLNLAGLNISGNLTVTATDITQSGNLVVGNATTLNAGVGNITLGTSTNNFNTVSVTNAGNVTLVDTNAINLGTSNISGNLSVNAAGGITESGPLNITGNSTFTVANGNSIILDANNNFNGTVGFNSTGTIRDITVRDSDGLNLAGLNISGNLTVTATDITQSGSLVVGNATTLNAGTGDITLGTSTNNFNTVSVTNAGNVSLVDTNAINLGISNISGALNVSAGGNITESGSVQVTGDSSFTVADRNSIILDANNSFNGAVSFTASTGNINNLTIVDSDALDLAVLRNITGNLTVTATGITQSGSLVVGNATTLNAGVGNITLGTSTNNFNTVSVTNAGNVTLVDTNAINLSASNISGNLTVTATGITQSGSLVVGNATTLNAGTGDILLNASTNNFNTVSVTNAGNVSLVDTNAINLGISNISGALNVSAGGNITESGSVQVTGDSSFTVADRNSIILDANNSFNGAVSFTASTGNINNLTIVDSDALDLAVLRNITGNLTVTATGITQSGSLVVGNATTLNAGTGDILLNTSTNNFNVVSVTNAGNVTLVDTNAINLSASNISGNLSVNAAGGITESGALRVTGDSSFIVANGNSIILDANNNFNGTVGFNSTGTIRDITVRDSDGLNLAGLNISGNLTVTATDITQSGNLVVGNATTLNAGVGNILLNTSTNNFNTVSVTNAGNVTLVDTNAINLSASNISGALNVSAGGNITESESVQVTGDSSFTVADRNSIILDANNSFNGTVGFNSTGTIRDITVRDSDGLNLAGLNISGNLTVTATDITQSGSLVVGNATTLNAGIGDILLNTSTNNFNTVSVTNAGNVTLVDTNAINLGISNVSGALNVSAGGNITESGSVQVTGDSSFTVGDGNSIILDANNNFNGTVGFNSTGTIRDITVRDSDGLNLAGLNISGNLTVTATDVTQSGSLVVGNATTLNAGTGDITLGTSTNNFNVVSVTNAGNVTLVDTNAINLSASNISGNLTVTATDVTQNGSLVVGNATTLNAGVGNITLGTSTNNFNVVSVTNAGNVSLVDTNAINLGISNVSGNLSVNAAGGITESGSVQVTGDSSFTVGDGNSIILDANNSFNGTVGFNSTGTIRDITVRDSDGLNLAGLNISGNLTVTATDITQSGNLVVGNATTLNAGVGNITLGTSTNNFNTVSVTNAGNVSLVDTNAINLGISNVSGALNVSAGGNITESGSVQVTGDSSFTVGDGNSIILDVNNSFNGTVGFNSIGTIRDITVRDSDGLNLAGLNISGNLTVTATGITQNGSLVVGNATTLNAGTGDITLGTSTNNFNVVSVTNAGNVTLVDTNAINLSASNISGNLTVTATDVTQSGSLVVGNATTLNTGVGNITLGTSTNNFNVVSVTNAGNVTLVDTNAINLGISNISGNLTVTATGITQSGSLVVGNATTLNAGTGDITLGTSTNNFNAVSVTNAGNVTLVDTNTINLGTSNISGNLGVNAAGGITESGALRVTGDSSFTVGDGNSIILDANNSFNGTVGFNSTGTIRDITVRDSDGLNLAGLNISGNLTVTATGITQSGSLVVGNATTLNAGVGNITLGTSTNNFNTVSVTNAGNVTLVDTNAINLSASNISGNLTVTATGITQSGSLVVGNATTLNAGTGDILLNTSTNNFNAVSVVNAGNVTLVDTNTINLSASNISGNLGVNAAGGITESGPLNITGNSTFTVGDGASIILDANNSFNGAVSFGSAGRIQDITIVDSNALDLTPLNITGDLNATAAGITDSGLLRVGNNARFNTGTSGGDITLDTLSVNGTIALNTGSNATIVNANGVNLAASNVGGTLSATATNGNIQDSGNVVVGGSANFTTVASDASIALDSLNIAGPIALSTGSNATIVNANGVNLAASNVGGVLSATATSGNITESGALRVTGDSSFTVGDGASIILDANNNFNGAVSFGSAGRIQDITIVDSNALDLTPLNITGDLNATAAGITDSGLLRVGNNARFNTGISGGDITLDTLSVNGTIALNTGSNATIVNANGVNLAASNISGTLSATATNGNITQSGNVTVGSSSTFTAAGEASILLGNVNNAFGGSISFGSTGTIQDITIVDSDALDLAGLNISGNLSATAAGITDSGLLRVGNNARFNVGISGGDITLDTLSVNGTIALNTGSNATIVNANGVNLAASNIGGVLSATATNGNIQDSGNVVVGGSANFTTVANNAFINLDSLNIAGPIALNTGSNATIVNANGVNLAASNVGGVLSATATNGNIQDSGNVVVGGSANFTTVANNAFINLDSLNITGPIALSTANGGNATVVNTNINGVNLATSTIGGALDITATNGSITQSGSAWVAGNSSFTVADRASVLLGANNTFGGNVSFGSLGTLLDLTIIDISDLTLTTVNIAGNLSVLTTGGSIQDGGIVTVGGSANFTTTASNASITLDTLNVAGAISLNTVGAGGNVTILNSNANGVNLAASNVGGVLSATATSGDIQDSGNVVVGGSANFTTVASDASIELDSLNIAGPIALNTGNNGNATIVNANGVNLAASNIGGTLSATATNGDIQDSGDVVVGGSANFTTVASDASITLDSLNIAGPIALSTGSNATIVNANGVNLAASNIGGTLSATATSGNITESGAVQVTGDSSFTVGDGNSIILDANNNFNGAVSFGSAGRIQDITIVDSNALDLTPLNITGDLNATAAGITDSGLLRVGNNARFNVGISGGDITLDTLSVNGTIALNTGSNATIVNANGVNLAASNISGTLSATATNGNIQDSGNVVVGGSANFTTVASDASIALDSLNIAGPIALSTSSNATIVNANGVNLAASNIGGTLSATATSGNITESGALRVTGDSSFTVGDGNSIILDANNNFNGAVSFGSAGRIQDITIVDSNALDLTPLNITGDLNATAAGITDSGLLRVGNNARFNTGTSGGGITLDTLSVNGTIALNTGSNATIVNANGVNLAASNISGTLSATATNGNIQDSGNVVVGGSANFTTVASDASIALDSLNIAGPIALSTGSNATIVNANGVNLAASNIGGTLSATATSGNITESGALRVTGDSSFTVGDGNSIILDANNNFNGAVSFGSAGRIQDITIVDSNALDLTPLNITGDLNATAAGITDSGLLRVGNNARFNTGTSGGDITLDTLSVNGTIALNTGSNATIVNANGVNLAASNIGGVLSATATNGNIQDSGNVVVGGSANFTTVANNAFINLDSLNIAGPIALSTGSNATIVNANGVNLAASNIGGTLSATATSGNITESGALRVTGDSSFTVGDGNSIILDANNNFNGAVSFGSAGRIQDITIVDSNALDLTPLNITGDLNATAAGITDSGLLRVGNNARFNTGTSGGGITLDTLSVNGTITLNTDSNATIVNANGVNLAASNISGTLSATATNGNIQDSGNVVVGGSANFTTVASDASIALDSLNITGPIALNTGSNATIVNVNGVNLAASNIGGTLSATATSGNITESGAVQVTGDSSFTVGDGNSIILDANNNFNGAVSFGSAGRIQDITIIDTLALNLTALDITGDLNATAAGITDSGLLRVGNNARFNTGTSGGDITLDTLSVNGTITLNTDSNATIVNANGVNLAASNISGTLSATATNGDIQDSGDVVVGGSANFTTVANNTFINLDSLNVTGPIALSTGSNGNATIVNANGVNLAASNIGGVLSATATNGNIQDSGNVVVGGSANFTTAASDASIELDSLNIAGPIALNTGNNGNATIVNANGVNLTASNVGGVLSATATNGDIQDSGNVVVGGSANFTTVASDASIALNSLNVAGPITLNTGSNATIVNVNGVNLAASNVGGVLSATATSGDIQDSGNVVVGGSANFTTVASDASIELDSLNIAGPIALNTGNNGNATIVNANGVNLAASNIGGVLSATATSGNITESGAVQVTGDSSFTVANGASILLDNANNTFGGTVNFASTGTLRDITIADTTALNLQALRLTGDLDVAAAGITSSGALVVGGTTTLAAGGNNITLSNSNNNFSTVSVTSGRDVTLADLDSLDLGASNLTGNLSLTAAGITDSGALVVGGTATLAAGNNDITLDQGENNFNTVSVVSGRNVTLVDADALNLGTFNVANNLTLQAGGAVTQTGGITATGLALLGDGSYTLTRSDNDVNTLVAQTVGGISFRDVDDLLVDTINGTAGIQTEGGTVNLQAGTRLVLNSLVRTSGGDLTLTAGGTITRGTASTAGNLLTFADGNGGNVTLNAPNSIDLNFINAQSANGLGGNVDITTTGFFQALGTFSNRNNIQTSISTLGLSGGGAVIIRYGSGLERGLPFSVGDATVNGTAGAITADEISSVINPQGVALVFEGSYTLGRIQFITPNICLTNCVRTVTVSTQVPEAAPVSSVLTPTAESIDTDFTEDFQRYLGRSLPTQEPLSQTLLGQLARVTGKKPAVLRVRSLSNEVRLVLVTAEGTEISQTVPEANRRDLLRVVKEFRDAITAPDERNSTAYLKPAQQIYDWLIRPVESVLKDRSVDTLLLSLDTGLRQLPIAALHDGKQFLVEKYSLALIPSANLVDSAYGDVRKSQILAMGASRFNDPDFANDPLPGAALELKKAQQSLPGGAEFLNQDFTSTNLRVQREQKSFGVIHLATHADFQPGEPNASYVLFSDGRLGLDDLRKLRLDDPPVELLVLSACRTALGDEQAELGFAGVAVATGVKTALASLWYASDKGTLGMMTAFYDQLTTAPIKAEALRQAQISMLKRQVRLEKGVLRYGEKSIALPSELQGAGVLTLAHPYYWSGFTMVGSPW
ncbi:CHAT domain-containing protein [Anthocerotibacter panamensis]|uniref:CHAT domain-containing protein n=1 Tax=Anthocerotibacter panamensis TaxID=2857077 RepID=UPI001C401806|nr:CHAT domain-containing protein [Anthocerotibacter panamensis]